MQSTRQEILDILRQNRQATVEDLAERLGLTPMTIRHHLNVLQAQGLVVTAEVRRIQTVGRPRLVYSLTDAADELFPQGYGELAGHLVAELKEAMGPDETPRVFRRIADRIAGEVPPPVPGRTFEERLAQVSLHLKRLGFLFTWTKTDEGYLLTNTNCPYRRVAQEHAELCAMDMMLLRRVLGVEPTQISHVREGATSCTCLLSVRTD
jgi:predicted ArsR family transcriptional regulator